VSYSLHRGAENDLLEAARFYRQQGGPKLAGRFLNEFGRVVDLLVEFPGLGTPVDELRRVHRLQNFPYSVVYRVREGRIRILVVRSQYRDPEYGESRS
jgi:plasmid stabilization system protein ParE